MVMIREKGVPRDGAIGGSMGSTSATTCDANPRPEPPASPRSSGDFPPILHQYTSAIGPDDEARAIHWITYLRLLRFMRPPRDAWLPTQPSDSGVFPNLIKCHLPRIFTEGIAQEAYKAQ